MLELTRVVLSFVELVFLALVCCVILASLKGKREKCFISYRSGVETLSHCAYSLESFSWFLGGDRICGVFCCAALTTFYCTVVDMTFHSPTAAVLISRFHEDILSARIVLDNAVKIDKLGASRSFRRFSLSSHVLVVFWSRRRETKSDLRRCFLAISSLRMENSIIPVSLNVYPFA